MSESSALLPDGLPKPTTGGRTGNSVMWLTGCVVAALWALTAVSGLFAPLPAAAVVVLTLLPWLAVLTVLWSFLLWTILPDHPAGGWLLLASILAPTVHWGPSFPASPTAADAGTPLTAMTWNVRRLWGNPADEQDATACIVQTVQTHAPDVLLLQEVSAAELAQLAAPLGLDCVHGTYAEADATGSAGLAVCVLGERWHRQGGSIDRFRAEDDWRYVHALVSDGSSTITVLGVHLHPYRILHDPVGSFRRAAARLPTAAAAQQAQAETLLEVAGAPATQVLLGGDFNTTRDTPIHARLRRALDDTLEVGGSGYPSTVRLLDAIPMRIDYLYASRDLGVVSSEVPHSECSDHAPIVSHLRVLSQR